MLEPKKDLFEEINDEVREHYRFQPTPEEARVAMKTYMSRYVKAMVISLVASLVFLVIGCFADRAIAGFAGGLLFLSIVAHTKTICAIKKVNSGGQEKMLKTVYDYTVYDTYLIAWISSDESIRQTKIQLDKITNVQEMGALLSFETDKQIYIMRKADLIEGSYFIKKLGQSKKGKR